VVVRLNVAVVVKVVSPVIPWMVDDIVTLELDGGIVDGVSVLGDIEVLVA
jgi:hypothetical protein